MKLFIKYILFISLITLSLMFSLDRAYTYVYSTSFPRSKVQNLLRHSNEKYDLAFFGSSRTETHIDCEKIEELTGKSCVNFGFSGGSIADVLVLMNKLKDNNVEISKAYVQIDYNFHIRGLTPSFKAGLVPYRFKQYVRPHLSNNFRDGSYVWIPFYGYLTSGRIYDFREFINSILNKSHNYNIEIVFSPLLGSGKFIPGSFPESVNLPNNELEEIFKFSKKNNIELALFTAPYCALVKNRNYIDSLETKLPDLYNYVSIFDEKENYFYDCGHLNKLGGEEFSKILSEDILKADQSDINFYK